MWRAWLSRQDLRLTEPASEAEIAAAERDLGCAWPQELRELLLESDGVRDEYGGAVVRSARDVVIATRQMWALDAEGLYMAFSPHLFFGQEANGDEYFFRIVGDDALDDVFAWSHEDDERLNYAQDIRSYVSSRLEETRARFDPAFDNATLDSFLDCLAFLALSDDRAVDRGATGRQMESVAARLRAAPEEQRRAFAGRCQGLAAQERDVARAAFFGGLGRDLNLFPDAP